MFKLQSETRGEQTAFIDEMIGGEKVVKAYGYEEEAVARFDEINERLQKYSLRAIFFSSITNPSTRFVNSLVYAGVAVSGAFYSYIRWNHSRTAIKFSKLCQPVHQAIQRDIRCHNRASECTCMCGKKCLSL